MMYKSVDPHNLRADPTLLQSRPKPHQTVGSWFCFSLHSILWDLHGRWSRCPRRKCSNRCQDIGRHEKNTNGQFVSFHRFHEFVVEMILWFLVIHPTPLQIRSTPLIRLSFESRRENYIKSKRRHHPIHKLQSPNCTKILLGYSTMPLVFYPVTSLHFNYRVSKSWVYDESPELERR